MSVLIDRKFFGLLLTQPSIKWNFQEFTEVISLYKLGFLFMFLKKILSQKLFWCIYTQDNMQQISPWIRVCVCVCVCVCVSHSVVSDSVIPWTVARQALLSMEFSRQEYRNWLPCPPPGATELPYQSSRPRDWTQVSHVEGRFFTIWPTREAMWERLLNSQPSARTA